MSQCTVNLGFLSISARETHFFPDGSSKTEAYCQRPRILLQILSHCPNEMLVDNVAFGYVS